MKKILLVLIIFLIIGIMYFSNNKNRQEYQMDVGPFDYEDRCVKKSEECPKEKPFQIIFPDCFEPGNTSYCEICVGCNEEKVLYAFENTYSDLKECSNRLIIKEEGIYKSILKVCPTEFSLRDEEGNCLSCNDPQRSIKVKDKSACDICSNRTYKSEGECWINTCPISTPILGKSRCYSCEEALVLDVSLEECQNCSNRKYIDNKCILATTSNSEQPLVKFPPQFEDPADFTLFSRRKSCDTIEALPTIKESCDMCPNRIYKDGKCILKNK